MPIDNAAMEIVISARTKTTGGVTKRLYPTKNDNLQSNDNKRDCFQLEFNGDSDSAFAIRFFSAYFANACSHSLLSFRLLLVN